MDLTLFQDEVRVLQGYRVLKVDGNFKRHTLQHFAASDYIFCFVPRATKDKHHYLLEGKHRDFADITSTHCKLGFSLRNLHKLGKCNNVPRNIV